MKTVKKTVVDNNNVLWQMEYDASDNSVEIVNEYSTEGTAFLSQYSLDNALGHSIPQAVLSSAEEMLTDDDYASQGNEIDAYAFDNLFKALQD